MLEVIILGCGSSLGVPVIACECSVCTSDLPYNKRNRCAIVIRDDNTTILIDFGFEIRLNLLREKIKNLDAAILTHFHEDHFSGIDDLRVFPFIQKKPLTIYTDGPTAQIIENRYKFLFEKMLVAKPIENSRIRVGTLDMQILKLGHAKDVDSLGVKIGNFAYTNDVNYFTPDVEEALYNLDHWILDCRGVERAPHHFSLSDVLLLNEKFKPKKLYLTNMSHEIDYYTIGRKLPENVVPLFDGYKIRI